MNKIPLIIYQEWLSGFGEQTLTMHGFLTIGKFIKETFGDKYFITYKIWIECEKEIPDDKLLRYTLNTDKMKKYVDDVIFVPDNGKSYRYESLFLTDASEYKPVGNGNWAWGGAYYPAENQVLIHKDFYDEHDAKIIDDFIKNNITSHPMSNGQASYREKTSAVPVIADDLYSDLIKKIAEDYCNKNELTSFISMHYRIRAPLLTENSTISNLYYWWTPDAEKEYSQDTINLFSSLIHEGNKYFISSNSLELKKSLANKFNNIYYIARGEFERTNRTILMDDIYMARSMGKIYNYTLPDIIPDGLFDDTDSPHFIEEFLAVLEIAIMARCTKIIHRPGCGEYNDMISLFIWNPLAIHNIPVEWHRCNSNGPYPEHMIDHLTFDTAGITSFNRIFTTRI